MRVEWSAAARRDLLRLEAFLRPVSPRAGARVVRMLVDAAARLPEFPHIAPSVDAYEGRDVRSLIVGDYNIHYDVRADVISIVRVWHMREDR